MLNTALAVGITEDRCNSLHFYSLPLSRKIGKGIFLKLENLQVAQAFKARGNANKIALLNRKEKEKDVITAFSVAILLFRKFTPKCSKIVGVISGGNIDISLLMN